jgi:hypothetical protein
MEGGFTRRTSLPAVNAAGDDAARRAPSYSPALRGQVHCRLRGANVSQGRILGLLGEMVSDQLHTLVPFAENPAHDFLHG